MRHLIQRAAVCAGVSVLLASAPSAVGASQRTVTLTLSGSGKAFWKLDKPNERSRLALDYRWHGAISFDVGASALNDRRHRKLFASSAATLVATWIGHYTDKRAGTVTTCTYRGAKVKSRVTARLAKGRVGNTLELTLHPGADGHGFFSDKGHRAVISCSAGYAQSAPAHFAPSWFFRDNLQDHGRLSSATAVIVLPSTLLPRSVATVAFPNERGRNDSVALGQIAWNNRAETAVRAR